MAKTAEWTNLTLKETETLEMLMKKGAEVYAAPIEIEYPEQMEVLGITWETCRTWRIGNEKVIVHLTPADKTTHDMLLREMRNRHCKDYRRNRCMIHGKTKPSVLCPVWNKCAECPYPECRDQHRANQVSWERLTESAGEGNDDLAREDPDMRQVEIRADLEAVCREIDRKNPLYTQAIRLKELYRMSIDEIAERMNTSRRNVYFYISEAKKIGKEYKEKTER